MCGSSKVRTRRRAVSSGVDARLREGRIDDLTFSGDFTVLPALAVGALEQAVAWSEYAARDFAAAFTRSLSGARRPIARCDSPRTSPLRSWRRSLPRVATVRADTERAAASATECGWQDQCLAEHLRPFARLVKPS